METLCHLDRSTEDKNLTAGNHLKWKKVCPTYQDKYHELDAVPSFLDGFKALQNAAFITLK